MAASLLKSEIMERTEFLSSQIEDHMPDAQYDYARACCDALASMVYRDLPVFTLEHWHGLDNSGNHDDPAELLLRLKTAEDAPLAPYPFIMSCYDHGLTSALDMVLLMCALYEYVYFHREQGETNVSINISSKFLEDRYAAYAHDILYMMDYLDIGDAGITFEIHESCSSTVLSRRIMDQFYARGVKFAIDDVKANVNDILRLSSFKNYINFIKLDRSLVNKSDEDPVFFGGMIDFFREQVPGARFVAEGVKTAVQARALLDNFKHIDFVQGRDLPGRAGFASCWAAA